MLDYLKKLFGFSKAEATTPAAPYKVEAPAPVVETTSAQPSVVEATKAAKPKAAKPKAKPATAKPKAAKPKAKPAARQAKIRVAK